MAAQITDYADSEAAEGNDAYLLTVEEAAKLLRIGRTKMYSLISSGEVESVLIGERLRRVPPECLTAYVTKLRAIVRSVAA